MAGPGIEYISMRRNKQTLLLHIVNGSRQLTQIAFESWLQTIYLLTFIMLVTFPYIFLFHLFAYQIAQLLLS